MNIFFQVNSRIRDMTPSSLVAPSTGKASKISPNFF